jgi:hypothetical protein
MINDSFRLEYLWQPYPDAHAERTQIVAIAHDRSWHKADQDWQRSKSVS